ncbi:hypothetical protein TVAG_358250 [Trichomonas vaginalis G3]|uniref:Uncharacterized protein n=1 Tax=Trichomonas vaginalis (strain ATCC PRA-98 / G3) TaxID=412133 RepID=A2ELD3_TRIV3|nr:hypothetical protein TVAGG3_0274480 [Trichomonas vaginalis G3]EAY06535.1 hypothetical protein TVAG_358250 [Trichomonas vaginalis G3]KAI5526104.1 hypothetical protein TVAGG3_0274480 [Trichomonas vaginalis G3]|eukprot:XP_001318758.1 hypothetical protein [Trichomonas vaginalis G3]
MLPIIEVEPLFKVETKTEDQISLKTGIEFYNHLPKRDELLDDNFFIMIELPNKQAIFEWFKKDTKYMYVSDFVKYMLSKPDKNYSEKFRLIKDGVPIDLNSTIEGDKRQYLVCELLNDNSPN